MKGPKTIFDVSNTKDLDTNVAQSISSNRFGQLSELSIELLELLRKAEELNIHATTVDQLTVAYNRVHRNSKPMLRPAVDARINALCHRGNAKVRYISQGRYTLTDRGRAVLKAYNRY